jgi:hypothetical protein
MHIVDMRVRCGASGLVRGRGLLESSLQPEEGDHVSMSSDDGERVAGGHEELSAQNHVAVSIAISSGSEARDGGRIGAGHHEASAINAHNVTEISRIGEVGVSVTAVEVVLGHCVDEHTLRGSELAAEHLPGVRPLHTVHAVVAHGEVRALDESRQLVEVEDGLEKVDVVFSGGDDLQHIMHSKNIY